ncbi:hypothetical protein SB783_37615 [Paraburkholderia sp. SIMBA_009]
MADKELITSATLKELVDAGSIRHAVIVGEPQGFAIMVKYGLIERVVQARRGHVRRFKTIDAAAKTLHALGIVHAELDLSNLAVRETLFANGHDTFAGDQPAMRGTAVVGEQHDRRYK